MVDDKPVGNELVQSVAVMERGAIYLASLDPISGHEQQGTYPVLIIHITNRVQLADVNAGRRTNYQWRQFCRDGCSGAARWSRPARQRSSRPNEAWSMDFVSDQLANGLKFRTLTIVDVFSKEANIWSPP